MTKKFVNELTDGESINDVFLASEKQLRPNRNGDLYLQVRLSDKTGSLTAMMWNASQNQYDSFSNGDYVRVKGTAQLYNGGMQVIAKGVDKENSERIDEAEFATLSQVDVDKLIQRVGEILRGLKNVHLRNLAECFLVDEELMQKIRCAPAGVKNHHAYRGGLLQHLLSLMELCLVVSPNYPNVDSDVLMMGAFLHDLGKVDELTYEPDLGYSDPGQLIGHLVLGVRLLDEKIDESNRQSDEVFPEDLANHLRHLIVSHHGQYEFGSPKLPMTLEAIALHHLDNLDAKMHCAQQLIDEDANSESVWTVYNPALGRKIYKGQ
ncbi:MAG: OB-fold nucleic acid binding domain-containing protein [Planctomycetota bacterium]